MSLLRTAIGINGFGCFLFGPVLFFNHMKLIASAEGSAKAEAKTALDVSIWRICGLWVWFAGVVCLLVSDLPGGIWSNLCGFAPDAMRPMWKPLACLLALTHVVETGIKYEARGMKGLKSAAGNMVMGLLVVVGLFFP